MRRGLATLALGVVLASGSSPAAAHGIGQRYDLPIPLWLYLYGAAAAVVLSFVLIGIFAGERPRQGYPRFELSRVGWLHALLKSRYVTTALRLASAALFALTLATALFGERSVSFNFAPTFVWVVWWVGLGFFVALVANIWPLINPWKILFEWADALARRLGLAQGLELHEPYPRWLGVWPALAFYAAFIWMENVFAGAPDPRVLGIAILTYSLITWGGMAYYGRDVWLRNAEAFSVFFGTIGRFAPTEVRVTDRSVCAECSSQACRDLNECVDCEECRDWAPDAARAIALRPWAAGLLGPGPRGPGRVAFVVFVLAAVTFDGLWVTSAWQQLYVSVLGRLGTISSGLFQTLVLAVMPLAFFGVFALAIRLSGAGIDRGTGAARSWGDAAGLFVYSLVPIAIVYQIAHYATFLIAQGWIIVPLLSDPFAWGWDLLGTSAFGFEPILDAAVVWYAQVALIIAGHVMAVYLAHTFALRVAKDQRAALRDGIPLLVVMVAYTVSSLWILSQDVVSESELLSRAR